MKRHVQNLVVHTEDLKIQEGIFMYGCILVLKAKETVMFIFFLAPSGEFIIQFNILVKLCMSMNE